MIKKLLTDIADVYERDCAMEKLEREHHALEMRFANCTPVGFTDADTDTDIYNGVNCKFCGTRVFRNEHNCTTCGAPVEIEKKISIDVVNYRV
jgi:hypothetical protein